MELASNGDQEFSNTMYIQNTSVEAFPTSS